VPNPRLFMIILWRNRTTRRPGSGGKPLPIAIAPVPPAAGWSKRPPEGGPLRHAAAQDIRPWKAPIRSASGDTP
jgi:hypothetical protein